MPPQLDHLTRAQQAAAPSWAERWTEVGLRTGEADWAAFEAAARQCYSYAGLPWPGVVVRVSSPLVGALAAPIADQMLAKRKLRRRNAVPIQVRRTLRRRVDAGTRSAVTAAVAAAVRRPAAGEVGEKLGIGPRLNTPADAAADPGDADPGDGKPGDAEPVVVDPGDAEPVAAAPTAPTAPGEPGDALAEPGNSAAAPAKPGDAPAALAEPGSGAAAPVDAAPVAVEPLTDAERDSMDSLIAVLVVSGAILGTVLFLLLGVPVWALLGGAVAGLVCVTIAGSFAVGALVGIRGDPVFEVDAIDYPGRGKLNRLTLLEVGEPVRTQVDRRVFEPVDRAVRTAVGEAVIEAVDSTVLGAARASMISRVRPESRFLTGQWGVAHQARSSFYREACGLELPPEVWAREQAYAAAQAAVGWWWPHRGFVMVCDRPRVLHVQETDPSDPGNARLHCEDGPALAWADGWSLFYLRGVRVTRQVVLEPETLTSAQITRERNAEVRRIMMDRYGTERYLREAMAKQVNTDEFGTLWRLSHIGGEPIQLVQVVNSTPEPDGTYRDYFLRVPPDLHTAREAVAWTFQLPSETYRPTTQT